jgi:hypothetical protein
VTAQAPLPAERSDRYRSHRSISAKSRRVYLGLIAQGSTLQAAADATGHDRRRWWELRQTDEAFAAAFSDAFEVGTELLEDEAWRRAVEGYDEDTLDGDGNLIRRVRRYDSALLQTLLKGRLPRYRDGANVEVNVPAVFVLESAFGRHRVIEGEVVESAPVELPESTS